MTFEIAGIYIITIYNATLTEAPLGRDGSFAIIIRVIMK